MVVHQYDIWIINLDPVIGSEIRKTRPCVVISPDEMHRGMRTVQIAPMTSNTRRYPWRIYAAFQGKKGAVALDQIRSIDRQRMLKRAGALTPAKIAELKSVMYEMLIA